MVNIWKLIIYFFVFIPFAVANAEFAEREDALEELFGTYYVSRVERYRGGLTSSEDAFNQLEAGVELKESEFSFWDGTVYENPIYEIEDHPLNRNEGNVPSSSEKFGNFYGYGSERENVRTLNVYNRGTDVAPYVFEVVEDKLWMFLDGWFYRLERTSSEDGPLSFNKNAGACLNNEIRG